MEIKEKNVLVYGLSSSGEWVSRLLLKKKANVFLYDDDKEVLRTKKIKHCYLLNDLNEHYLKEFDFIVVSPSIEKDNFWLETARKLNKKIYSEVELASQFSKNIVAITGTNGKTTTVNLVAKILGKKRKTIACGNVGYPLSKAVLKNKHSQKIVEVSSFMLENAEQFAPKYMTLLNIAEDHLIRHKTMDEYKNLKLSIFKNCTKKDWAVINLDEKVQPSVKAKTITYSYSHYADVYVCDGSIYYHKEKIIDLNQIKIKGKHNVYNVMCAVCFGIVNKVKIEKIREAIREFGGEQFRIETVGETNGIEFVNDSKSTNIASTLACVESIKKPIRLLLGGSNKGLDYTKLFSKLSKKVKSIYAFGEITDDLIRANTKFNIKSCTDLASAFANAVNDSINGDAVVLSPASASFDQFRSFMERGNKFDGLVREYVEKNKNS